jgi:TRAP-type C4-dicarboxylate transport system permease large subunit
MQGEEKEMSDTTLTVLLIIALVFLVGGLVLNALERSHILTLLRRKKK